MTKRRPLEGANIVLLSICYQHLSARINRVLEPLKLNMTQMSILTHFSRLPEGQEETVSHLSQVMEMNQPMVTKAVKAMQLNGLIKREAGKEDARVSRLFLNNKGRSKLDQAQETCLPLLEQAFGELTNEELEVLRALLIKIKNRLT